MSPHASCVCNHLQCGAATFIEMVNASSLKVGRDEFIAHMLAAGAMTEEQLASLQSISSADMTAAAAGGTAAAAARQGSGSVPPSATQQNIQRSTQAAVAAATAAGIRPNDWQYEQQQQQFPLQMQPLPGAAAAANSPEVGGWPQAAIGHSSTGWPYQQQNQQQQQQQPPPPQQQQQLLPSVSELESQGAVLLSQRDPAAAARQLVSRHPFCCCSLDSLSLGDVGQLLAAYKVGGVFVLLVIGRQSVFNVARCCVSGPCLQIQRHNICHLFCSSAACMCSLLRSPMLLFAGTGAAL
jgi:hypothetical protein